MEISSDYLCNRIDFENTLSLPLPLLEAFIVLRSVIG